MQRSVEGNGIRDWRSLREILGKFDLVFWPTHTRNQSEKSISHQEDKRMQRREVLCRDSRRFTVQWEKLTHSQVAISELRRGSRSSQIGHRSPITELGVEKPAASQSVQEAEVEARAESVIREWALSRIGMGMICSVGAKLGEGELEEENLCFPVICFLRICHRLWRWTLLLVPKRSLQ